MNRYTLIFAYAWYVQLWGPTSYDARVNRFRVRFGAGARLETEDSDVKEAYGAIVRREHRLWIGYERLRRRQPGITPMWPGSRNMPRGEWYWLESRGLLGAVLALCP